MTFFQRCPSKDEEHVKTMVRHINLSVSANFDRTEAANCTNMLQECLEYIKRISCRNRNVTGLLHPELVRPHGLLANVPPLLERAEGD